MSKSTEKVTKKYADTYKWTDDEGEQLLTVTKEYKTKQIAKSIDWKSSVDKYGEILEALPSVYGLNPSASFTNDVLDILKFSLHSCSIIVPFNKIVPPCACPSWSRPESPSVMVRSFFGLYHFMMPTVH